MKLSQNARAHYMYKHVFRVFIFFMGYFSITDDKIEMDNLTTPF